MENLYEYRRELDALRFTSAQKDLLTERTRNAAEKGNHSVSRPVRRVALIAAVIAVIVAVGGGALALRAVDGSFSPVFGTAQTKVINKIGRPIDAGVTNNGITITADAIIGDKYNACIVCSVKRADGTPLGLPAGIPISNLSFGQSDIDLRGGAGSHGVSWFTSGNTGDSAVQFVETISTDKALKQGQVNAAFRTLQYFDPGAGKMVTLSDGAWKFGFRVNYEDSSIALPANETFSQDGLSFQVTGISISPVALHIEYQVNSKPDWGDKTSTDGQEPAQMRSEQSRYLGNVAVILTKKDGSTLDITSAGGSIYTEKDHAVCTKSGVFQEIIPTEEMKSISIGGVEIPIQVG